MATIALFSLAAFLATASAQQVGTNTAEVHPALSWKKCTVAGGCATQAGKVVLDANWRWTHSTSGYTNCYTGNTWDKTLCPDSDTCIKNCALDGADYSGTYGITTSGDALTLKFVTTGANKNVGSRVYLMNTDTTYQIFNAVNAEFTMDVDVSNLPCGLNGAVYFSEMDADGGMAKYPANKAGAKYGTGYCDSQCPRDLKFIAGTANVAGWTGTSTNSGTGNFGSCCNEMDLWEANSISTAYTPHPCSVNGLYKCTGQECGNPDRHGGVCDPDGCDFNSYRMGDKTFYGPGKTVDTASKFTVVTQFVSDNGSSTGNLVEIRRIYVQNGKVINNSKVNIPGMAAYDSITEQYCTDQKAAFGDSNSFADKGGLKVMGQSLARGGVLVLSVWDDYAVNMLWLDSTYPTDANPDTQPGTGRGTCPTTSGAPADVEAQSPNASVTYSNIRFGELGSTVPGVPAPGHSTTTTGSTTSTSKTTSTSSTSKTTTTSTTSTSKTTSSTTTSKSTTTSSGNTATQTHWGQCGGNGYSGPTVCAAPYTCKYSNDWYSQCL